MANVESWVRPQLGFRCVCAEVWKGVKGSRVGFFSEHGLTQSDCLETLVVPDKSCVKSLCDGCEELHKACLMQIFCSEGRDALMMSPAVLTLDRLNGYTYNGCVSMLAAPVGQ